MTSKHAVAALCCLAVATTLACKTLADTTCRTLADVQRENNRKVADEINANKERVAEIIRAIDDYQEEHARSPESLEVLVPAYLGNIPRTTAGHELVYALDKVDGHYLCFDMATKPNAWCCYLVRLKLWDCSLGPAH